MSRPDSELVHSILQQRPDSQNLHADCYQYEWTANSEQWLQSYLVKLIADFTAAVVRAVACST